MDQLPSTSIEMNVKNQNEPDTPMQSPFICENA